MKFLSLSCFAIGALAQGIAVNSPPAGTVLVGGESVVVQVIRYNFIMRATEVGVAIGIVPCSGGTCPNPLQQVGTVLHTGPFKPEYHGPGQQYENFTVTVPEQFPKGPASLQVARAFLIGAGGSPNWGDASVPVTIQ